MPEEEIAKWDERKIMSALSKDNIVELKVMKALEELEEPFTALVLIDAKNYASVKMKILEKYANNEIIYITLNSGFAKLKKDFEKHSKGYNNVHVVDLVSIEAVEKTPQDPNATYINSPANLTETMIVVEKTMSQVQAEKWMLVLDSVSTMLIYNNPAMVEKFTRSLLGKINSYNASAIVFSSDFEEREVITSTIGQFFDKTVKV